MLIGRLILGVLVGTIALIVALLAGLAWWVALLAYVAVGTLVVLGSLLIPFWLARRRAPLPMQSVRAER